jgi:hypothetical protein
VEETNKESMSSQNRMAWLPNSWPPPFHFTRSRGGKAANLLQRVLLHRRVYHLSKKHASPRTSIIYTTDQEIFTPLASQETVTLVAQNSHLLYKKGQATRPNSQITALIKAYSGNIDHAT